MIPIQLPVEGILPFDERDLQEVIFGTLQVGQGCVDNVSRAGLKLSASFGASCPLLGADVRTWAFSILLIPSTHPYWMKLYVACTERTTTFCPVALRRAAVVAIAGASFLA